MMNHDPHECSEHQVTTCENGWHVTFCSVCNETLNMDACEDAGTWPEHEVIPSSTEQEGLQDNEIIF